MKQLKSLSKMLMVLTILLGVSVSVKAAPTEVQFMCDGKIWGTFNTKENKFTRIKDGKVEYTRTMLANGDIMTETNERWGKLDEKGQLICGKNTRRIKYDPETMWVYDNGKVIGEMYGAKSKDGKEILSFTQYSMNASTGLVGKAEELKKLDLRLMVWLFYCFLKPEGNAMDQFEKDDYQNAMKRQQNWDKGIVGENNATPKIKSLVENALTRSGELTVNGETGRILGVLMTNDGWQYIRKEITNDVESRYGYVYVYIRYANCYRIRRYLISQLYKVGPAAKDESYGALDKPRLLKEELMPVYK